MKLLIIEDEPILLKDLGEFAGKEGYLYELAHNYSTAVEKIMLYDYDCVILDINLPDGSGFDIIQKLQKHQKSDGIIILSARDSLDDKIMGLGLGADDYLTKPFYYSELNARIKAIIRRKKFKTNKDIIFGNILIDLDQHLVKVSNEQLNFTKKEFAILTYLISNQRVAGSSPAWGAEEIRQLCLFYGCNCFFICIGFAQIGHIFRHLLKYPFQFVSLLSVSFINL